MKSQLSRLLAAGILSGIALGSPAAAINIVLNPDSSFSASPNGAAALFDFQKAANYWDTVLAGDTTINFDIHFDALGAGILGSTYSNSVDTSTSQIYSRLAANSSSSLDSTAVAHLRPLTAAGGLGYRTPGIDPTTGLTSAAVASQYDDNDSYNNTHLNVNTAINKNLGVSYKTQDTLFQFYNDNYHLGLNVHADADITFSSDFAFDFDPTNGISTGTYDFLGVATHEIGHALGFVSGTDDYDYNIGYETQDDVDNIATATVLDLFRYGSNNPNPDGSRDLQLDPNRPAYFSVDGQLPFNFRSHDAASSFFATGEYNGDGSQASHWQDANTIFFANGCSVDDTEVGIMDPTLGACTGAVVTSNDLAAMDAIGYNLNGIDINADRGYKFDTAQIYDLAGLAQLAPAVPEPASWIEMILGVGLIGALARTRRRPVSA